MVTRSQKEDMAKYVKEAVSSILQDEAFLEVLADKVSAHLKPLFEQQAKLMEKLEENVHEVSKVNKDLQRRINFLEGTAVRNTIRIIGLEDSGDKPEVIVNNLFNNVLKLNISPDAIDYVYRIKHKKLAEQKEDPEKVDKGNTFVVRFIHYKYKQLVIFNRKNLKSTGIKIYEELSQDTMTLFKKAVGKYSRQDVWVFGGKVYAKINGGKRRLFHDDLLF